MMYLICPAFSSFSYLNHTVFFNLKNFSNFIIIVILFTNQIIIEIIYLIIIIFIFFIYFIIIFIIIICFPEEKFKALLLLKNQKMFIYLNLNILFIL
jgi:hypothetical protein